MPRNRRFGFIHGSPQLHIIAHELGHGAVPQWNKNLYII